MTTPDENADWWYVKDVAAYAGIKDATVRAYMSRHQMPPPRMFNRTPAWKPGVIMKWRPRKPSG